MLVYRYSKILSTHYYSVTSSPLLLSTREDDTLLTGAAKEDAHCRHRRAAKRMTRR